jgi:predicted small metal-binding protein
MKVCKLCVAKFGFKLADKNKTFETDEELYEHIENTHGIPVMREGETSKQAEERCAKKGIVPDRDICQCEECKILRSEPSPIRVSDMEIFTRWK